MEQDENIESYLKKIKIYNFQIIPINIIVITGSNLSAQTKSSNNIIKKLFDILIEVKPYQIFFGSSKHSIIITIQREDSEEALRKIHRYITKKPLD